MSAMRVSIAMATFNGAAYVREQLDSFVAQTVLPDELVISDDRSDDDTLQIIERFAETAPFRVQWLRNDTTLGYAGNFSRALSMASGDIVFISDQDDVWFPEKIARITDVFREDPRALVVMNDAEFTDAHLARTGVTKLQQIRAAGLPDAHFVMGCCVAVRRDFLTTILPVPSTCRSHDDWVVAIARPLHACRVIPIALQFYRRHGGNVSAGHVSGPSKVTPFKTWWVRWSTAISNAVRGRDLELRDDEMLAYLHLLQNHRKELCELSDEERVRSFQEECENRLAVIRSRLAIRSTGHLARVRGIWQLWRRGGYAATTGLASMLKDLLVSQ
jgi:glycosyltransferase involved in cell wall biosynthesis